MKESLNIFVAVIWFLLVIGLAITMIGAALIYAVARLLNLKLDFSLNLPNLRLVK
jgi:hypothetical protein